MPIRTYTTKKGIRYKYRFEHNNKAYTKGGFLTSKEAKKEEAIKRNKIEKAGTSDILLDNLVDEYLEDAKTRVRQTTMLRKNNVFKLKVLGKMPNKKISEIKPSDIRKWQNELISSGMKGTSLRTMHDQLTALFNYAVKFHGLRINPCRIAGTIGKAKREAEDLSFWTFDNVNEAIKVLDDEVCKISVLVLFYTGVRSGELRALTWGDINLEKMEIHINKTVVENGGSFGINKPKTPKGTRTISLPQKVNEALVKWKEKQYKATQKTNVFPVTRHMLKRRIDGCSDIANLPKIRIHDLRHSHASLLIELGVNVIEISERLGHENIQTTLNTYSHLYPNKQKEVAEKINKLAFDWL